MGVECRLSADRYSQRVWSTGGRSNHRVSPGGFGSRVYVCGSETPYCSLSPLGTSGRDRVV